MTDSMYQGSAGTLNVKYSEKAGTNIGNGIKQKSHIIKDLGSWFRTVEAKSLTGKWVLLDPEYRVIDSAERTGPLLKRRREEGTPFIVFVDPAITLGIRMLHTH